jgi:hypothetical protein
MLSCKFFQYRRRYVKRKTHTSIEQLDACPIREKNILLTTAAWNCSFNVEFTVFSAGCIFPTTFSVEAAFERREAALQQLARLKARSVARLCTVDWIVVLCAIRPAALACCCCGCACEPASCHGHPYHLRHGQAAARIALMACVVRRRRWQGDVLRRLSSWRCLGTSSSSTAPPLRMGPRARARWCGRSLYGCWITWRPTAALRAAHRPAPSPWLPKRRRQQSARLGQGRRRSGTRGRGRGSALRTRCMTTWRASRTRSRRSP